MTPPVAFETETDGLRKMLIIRDLVKQQLETRGRPRNRLDAILLAAFGAWLLEAQGKEEDASAALAAIADSAEASSAVDLFIRDVVVAQQAAIEHYACAAEAALLTERDRCLGLVRELGEKARQRARQRGGPAMGDLVSDLTEALVEAIESGNEP